MPPTADDRTADQVADRAACSALTVVELQEVTGAATRLTAATILPADGDQPTLCRITGVIEPQVGFEVRLPLQDWNGRLLVTGCTNLCGVIEVQGMEDALARGYATATTDLGHHTGDIADASWAWNNPALEADMGHRATHVTTVAAKELVANYYGNNAAYAYFRGCGTGGRQALVSAERYPQDFNGIIAGAPFNQQLSVPYMAWAMAANTGADGQPILRAKEFALLGRAALAACDVDGVNEARDGVINNPPACGFKPASLACDPDDPSRRACLTQAQVTAAEQIYAGPAHGNPAEVATGRGVRAWPPGGAPIGSEFSWEKALLAPKGQQSYFAAVVHNWLQYFAFEPDPPLASKDTPLPAIDFAAGPEQFAASNAVLGFTGNLASFRDVGGRLIIHHGWADQSLMPAHTLNYWREAEQRLADPSAQQAADKKPLDEFARLYMVPGMQHCGGGPGATDIDYLSAMERWVEQDQAPGSLLAYKVKGAIPTSVRQPRFAPAPGSVIDTRPVAPW